jgi:hypothetical protein
MTLAKNRSAKILVGSHATKPVLSALKVGAEIADKWGMSLGPISSLTSGYLQSILGAALQTVGLSRNSNTATTTQTSAIQQSDGSQLSPFAQVLSTLQQLQQSNPAQYQQVTQQIATNLQNAAQKAQSEGNTTAANQLSQLAKDFTTASQNGQLPNVKDLAQAAGGHHHHHHHIHVAAADGTSSTTGDSGLSRQLAAFQTNATQNQSLNPFSIIENTLANAGITGSSTS